MTMLVVDDVFSGYGKSQVLHGVSLSVDEGEIVALIGANGAGKTTLLKTISGLVQARSGTIKFQNTEIQNLSAHRIVESGVSQVAEGRAMLKRMTVLENLRIGAHVRKDKEVRQDIDQIFSKFPVLGERHDQLAGLLSGGEQQMLAIGRALMARPRILLLDEPSLGLAPMVVTEIFRTLRALRDDEKTIFLVEQNARRALQVADRGYVLERGQITLEGTGQRLLNDETIQQTYLGKRA
ncbi:Branched-chain amino acid transport ATP-binding protein LivF (TC 3.A.1.4.1) [hydrothermal vent metagenome]|jgi:branched-chain amino acid transport system ATP-binding protein|uniref:Branched-chain amino acid transport ATP-binding protein LivF (TC 3.A.1.4.1) n=1 Tax=hydrothermal vent metagenome TaxID=652676 RepID=A0A161K1C5_9ZZZZ|tara:strand:+ start:593 stop:1306 length:714 start_codon:yes stop_codon:yes gene_type:complete